MAPLRPLVSVITIVKNGAETIETAIQSVLAQNYPNIEYIVKDCQSTDGTIELLERYREYISVCVSTADCGISDGWNQALRYASGEYIAFLNCDDEWSESFISRAVDAIVSANADLTFGDTILSYADGSRRRVRGSWHFRMLWKGTGFLFPSVLASRKTFSDDSPFRRDLRYAMDTDWLVRLSKSGAKFVKHDGISHMSTRGVSNLHWKFARREYIKILRENNLPVWIWLLGLLWFGLLLIRKSVEKS